jgi:hypothetical protein
VQLEDVRRQRDALGVSQTAVEINNNSHASAPL